MSIAIHSTTLTNAIQSLEETGSAAKTEKAKSAAGPSDMPAAGKSPAASETPKLSLPTLRDLSGLSTIPSMGASVLALIIEISDEQRRANRESIYQQTQSIVDKMHAQADAMRDTAVTQLALGITSAAITIGASVYTIGASASALKSVSGSTLSESMQAALLQTRNAQIGAASQGLGGLGTIASSASEYVGTAGNAASKVTDAEIEQLRGYKSVLESLDESLKEVVQKAISTQDQIAQNTNQTRVKILS